MGTHRFPDDAAWDTLVREIEGCVMFPRSILVLVLALCTLSACRKAPRDHVAEVEAMVLQLEALLEKRDLGELKELIASTYKDARGQTKAEVVRFIQFQFLKRRTIGLVLHIRGIELNTPLTEADVNLVVGAGSTPVHNFKALSDLNADLFEVNLKIVDTGDGWRLKWAEWKRMRFKQLDRVLENFEP